MLPKNLEAIFLDFDGVVLESAEIKTKAFYDVYLSYGPDIAEKARQHHLNHQGVNRLEKFKHIHNFYLKRKCEYKELEIMSKKFTDAVFQRIIACECVPGVISFLEKYQNRKVPVFLLSATPHDELLLILELRKLSPYFTEVYGAPNEKKTAGLEIINRYNFKHENLIFIGDSISDCQAAKSMGVPFLGRLTQGNDQSFAGHPVINNFLELA